MLNTTICHEDDSLRSYVAKFIEQYFKRNHIQYKISCCPSLHNLTTRFHPIDLLFTDIIFSDKTEMSTLLKIRKQHPSMMMVILTNNNEYAIQGYKLGILRYIMKEQLEHELSHCMDRNHVQTLPVGDAESHGDVFFKQARLESITSQWDAGDVDHTRFGWLSALEDETLYNKLRALSDKDLELLTLLYVDGFQQADIARRMNCSRNAVHKRLKKIKKILKKG